MPYEKCSDVSPELWEDLGKLDPGKVTERTGASYRDGCYHLPFLDRELVIDPERGRIQTAGAPETDLGFRVCLTALLYLLRLNIGALGPPLSPMELPGGATFFRGPHSLPQAPLEERFGQDAAALVAAGARLHGEKRAAGDGAVALQVFPGLVVEVILWQGDEEFPPQVTFTLPARLDHFWNLDAVWGLLNLVAQEMLNPGAPG
ncbi:MAG: hypothetical protein A2Z73_00105 [Deltaproteobacteria bacterium RBG_13_60_28]|nr:MAG: hypothetical protein A2Z73_00105 [Deltaproteobacteria bacterium RBG_13_60_28]